MALSRPLADLDSKNPSMDDITLPPVDVTTVEEQLSDFTCAFLSSRMADDPNNRELPAPPRLLNRSLSQNPEATRNIAQVATNLAAMGDEIDRVYGESMSTMISTISGLTLQNINDKFTKIAMMVFEDKISWGRILVMLTFAYRMCRSLLLDSMPASIRGFIDHILQFMRSKLVAWIASKGGWIALLHFANRLIARSSLSWPMIFSFLGVGCLTIAAITYTRGGT